MKPSRKRRKQPIRKKSFKGGHFFEEKICLDEHGNAGSDPAKYKTRFKRQINPFYKRNEKCYTAKTLQDKTAHCEQFSTHKDANEPEECKRINAYAKTLPAFTLAPFNPAYKSFTTTKV